MKDPLFLGVDLGTSGCKTLLCDSTGAVRGSAGGELEVEYLGPRLAESDPEFWWKLVATCVRQTIAQASAPPHDIVAVGITGFMHSPVLLDKDDRPVARAMLWSDQRCAPQAAALAELLRGRSILGGLNVSTMWTAPKLRWLVEERPDLVEQARRFLLPKDYIRFRLTGHLGTDFTDASGTLLFDRATLDWSPELLEWVGVPREKYPTIQSALAIAGKVTDQSASFTGLAPGTPVIVGSGDAPATLVGTNAHYPDNVCLYMGTAGWVSTYATVDDMDAVRLGMRGFGTVSCTGSAFTWAREVLRGWDDSPGDEIYSRLTREAAEVGPGADGLLFAPHLMGERGNPTDPHAKGYLFGLTLGHRRAHVARAVLEGTAFGLRRSIELGGHEIDAGELVVSGGGARSRLWRQIFAHVFGRPVAVPLVTDTGAFGAAIQAAVAVGASPDVHSAAARWVRLAGSEEIDPDLVDHYGRIYQVYRDLDTHLSQFYSRLPVP